MNKSMIPELCAARVVSAHRLVSSPVGITTTRKDRERWAVALKAKGRTIYQVNGKEILSDGTHPVLLPKGSSYSWKCLEAGPCYLIEFDAEPCGEEILSFAMANSGEILRAFEKIEKALAMQQEGCQLVCLYHLYGVLMALNKSTENEYIPSDRQQLIQPAVQYMTEYYADPGISNQSLAALCGISTVYFRKTFEMVMGVSPIRYLQNLRLEKAKAMLNSDYHSIQQIAESVGYGSIYHFSKIFKQQTGVSPREYARKEREKK